MGDHERILQIRYDDICMEKNLFSTRFKGTFGLLKRDEKSFFSTKLLGFTHNGIINLLMQFMLIAQVFIKVIKF